MICVLLIILNAMQTLAFFSAQLNFFFEEKKINCSFQHNDWLGYTSLGSYFINLVSVKMHPNHFRWKQIKITYIILIRNKMTGCVEPIVMEMMMMMMMHERQVVRFVFLIIMIIAYNH